MKSIIHRFICHSLRSLSPTHPPTLTAYWRALSPTVPLIGQGLAYSAFAAVLWPSVPFTVPQDRVGKAYGLTTAIQNGGLALFPLLAAAIYKVGVGGWVGGFFLLLRLLSLSHSQSHPPTHPPLGGRLALPAPRRAPLCVPCHCGCVVRSPPQSPRQSCRAHTERATVGGLYGKRKRRRKKRRKGTPLAGSGGWDGGARTHCLVPHLCVEKGWVGGWVGGCRLIF